MLALLKLKKIGNKGLILSRSEEIQTVAIAVPALGPECVHQDLRGKDGHGRYTGVTTALGRQGHLISIVAYSLNPKSH